MCKGQNLVEFIIILALIVIAGIMVLTLFGNNIKEMFSGSAIKYAAHEPFKFDTNNTKLPSIKAGSLGGTEDKPVQVCKGDTCVIDYGTFALSGVPKDFNSYVEAAGSSGTSHLITGLIDQIVAQLESQGLDEKALAAKKLSSIGHNFALVEEIVQEMAESCNYDKTCMNKKMETPMPRLNELDTAFIDPPVNATYFDMVNAMVVHWYNDPNNAIKKDSTDPECTFYKTFYESLDELENEPSLSSATKGVINELVWHYEQIATDVHNMADATHDFNVGPQNMTNYNASSISNFDSALICAAGKYKDTGKKCH